MLNYLYTENLETTGKCLRLALQQIARHNLPYNPIVYAVWYEYASGKTPELNQFIDSHEATDTPITFDIILDWFRTYIADHQTLLTEKKTRKFKSIISEMSKNIGDSGDRMAGSETRIETVTEKIDPAFPDTVKKASRAILSEARSILSENRTLKDGMDETILEIDTLKKELEGLKQAAKTDTLTGLLNRRGFDAAIDRAMEEAATNDTPLTVILCDIDHFKKVNDTHGHIIGDNVLKMLSKLLKDQIKGKDIAARFGGEEFIIVLPNTGLKGGFALAEQIRESLQSMRWRAKNTGKTIGPITISLGVARYRAGEGVEALIHRADEALYFAKENGRNKTITQQDLEDA